MKKIGWLIVISLLLCSCSKQQISAEKRLIARWDAEPLIVEPNTRWHESMIEYCNNSWEFFSAYKAESFDPTLCLFLTLNVPEKALDYAGEIFIALYGKSQAHQQYLPLLMGFNEDEKIWTVYFAPNKFSLLTSNKVILSFSSQTGKVLGIQGNTEITPLENEPVINRLYWHMDNVEIRNNIKPVCNAYPQTIISDAQSALDIASAIFSTLNDDVSFYEKYGHWEYEPTKIVFDQKHNRWLIGFSKSTIVIGDLEIIHVGGDWNISLDAQSSEVLFRWMGE